MLSYQDALNQLKRGEKRSILIANGFSQAWDAKIFNYAKQTIIISCIFIKSG